MRCIKKTLKLRKIGGKTVLKLIVREIGKQNKFKGIQVIF
jgi:hypothetical protein